MRSQGPSAPPEDPIGVIGAQGRVGALLVQLAGPRARPVTRTRDTVGLDQPGPAFPLVVCTRNDDLAGLLPRVHPSRRADLVFVQNGVVGPFLAEQGLEAYTQGVLYVAVTHVGAPPVGGGTSVFCGPHAEAVAALLRSGGVPAQAVDRAALNQEIAVKLAWIAIFGLLGQALGLRVGALAQDHSAEVEALGAELLPLLHAELGLSLPLGALIRRLLEYSAAIPDFPASVKEWRWRNGWVVERAAQRGLPLPLHAAWCARARVDYPASAASASPTSRPSA